MKLIYQLALGAALLAGVAIGYCIKTDVPAEVQTEKKPVAAKPIDDVGVLRERRIVTETVVVTNVITITNGVDRPRQDPGSWLENLKKTDPQRYVQMTNRFATFRRNRRERAESKLGFLATIDTSAMTADQKANHERLQQLIADRDELEERLHNPDLTPEERQQLFQEMGRTGHDLWRTGRAERDTLIGETARDLGLEGEAAADFAATINDIIQVTEDRPMFPHGGRHGGPHGGPGGPHGGPGGPRGGGQR